MKKNWVYIVIGVIVLVLAVLIIWKMTTPKENIVYPSGYHTGDIYQNATPGASPLAAQAGYPASVLPLFPNATVVESNKVHQNGNDRFIYKLTLNTDKSLKTVYDYYKAILKDAPDFIDQYDNNVFNLAGTKGKYLIQLGGDPLKDGKTVEIVISVTEQ